MWVAKIGGSLHGCPRLATWLAAFQADTRRRWLLVPGGGPYADAVRQEQQAVGYDDGEAHARAIAAMARYGADLLGLAPTLRVVRGVDACLAHASAAPGLWLPTAADVAAFAALPADWRVTSDSLAHAMAQRLRADALLLVKSVAPGMAEATALAGTGYVDSWLPRLMAETPAMPVYWAVAAQPPAWGAYAGAWPVVGQRIEAR